MSLGVSRREQIEKYATTQTAPTQSEQVARALEGRLFGDLNTDETVEVLLRTVRALYQVTGWLADELDKIEAAPAVAASLVQRS